jgi:cofilin|tara:strand:+ start:122 stop:445 length:324 start_codon:yes stop_codon:yes gene_type:complete
LFILFTTFVYERVQAEFKFEKFLSLLPETESRYAVLDWDVTTDDGRQFSKLFFISWVPDSCKAKEKMLYASSKQSLRNALSGVHLDHQAADMDDVTEEIFTLKALGK